MSNLKKLVSEAMASGIDEATYPEGFSLKQFEALPSFRARVKYAQANLRKLGSGSSRIAFSVDDGAVLKIAKNEKGLQQNSIEADVGKFSDVYPVAKVFASGDDDAWIEVEKARKAKPSDFQKIASINFKLFSKIIYHEGMRMRGRSSFEKTVEEKEEMDKILDENYFVQKTVDLMSNYSMPFGDLVRISSWGVVNREGKDTLVLVDYGLTYDVLNKFYAQE